MTNEKENNLILELQAAIAVGTDFNALDENGNPYFWKFQTKEMLKSLLEFRKINLAARNKNNKTLFEVTLEQSNENYKDELKFLTYLTAQLSSNDLPGVVSLKRYDNSIEQLSYLDLALRFLQYKVVDVLLKKGAVLPKPEKTRESFNSTADYYDYLTKNEISSDELYIALRLNPNLLNAQDENGRTLLHHACLMGHYGLPAMRLLFDEGADPNILDNNLGTPLHHASHASDNRYIYDYSYEPLLKGSQNSEFDFSKLNRYGQAVIHIVARTVCHDRMFEKKNMWRLLEIPDLEVNILSSSGSTAFYYAINSRNIDVAMALFAAGADPLLCSNPERDPLEELDNCIEEVNNAILEAQKQLPDLSQIEFDDEDFVMPDWNAFTQAEFAELMERNNKGKAQAELKRQMTQFEALKQSQSDLKQFRKKITLDYGEKLLFDGSFDRAVSYLKRVRKQDEGFVQAQLYLADILSDVQTAEKTNDPEHKKRRIQIRLKYYDQIPETANDRDAILIRMRRDNLLREYYNDNVSDIRLLQKQYREEFVKKIKASATIARFFKSTHKKMNDNLEPNKNAFAKIFTNDVNDIIAAVNKLIADKNLISTTETQRDRLANHLEKLVDKAIECKLLDAIELHQVIEVFRVLLSLSDFPKNDKRYHELIRKYALAEIISAQVKFLETYDFYSKDKNDLPSSEIIHVLLCGACSQDTHFALMCGSNFLTLIEDKYSQYFEEDNKEPFPLIDNIIEVAEKYPESQLVILSKHIEMNAKVAESHLKKIEELRARMTHPNKEKICNQFVEVISKALENQQQLQKKKTP